jgi:branched-chain amino acid transport system permease protein
MRGRSLPALWPTALAILALSGIGAALPLLGVSSYARTLVYYAAYYLALGQAWNLISGMTGYVSFAHGALAGIGSYAAVMALNAELPVAVGLAAGVVASVIASLVVGATSLRLRGTSFTFATLFFQELVLLLLRKLPFTGGPGGLVLEEIYATTLPYLLMMATAAGATLLVLFLRASRTGIRVLAIKHDETAAAAIGIDATRMKIVLFAASAAVAGLVGAVHAIFTASLYPDVVFSVDVSLVALAVPLIGGVGTAAGPVLGAALYVGIRELLQVLAPGLHLAIVGLLLLAVVLFMRDGVLPTLARRIASRRERAATGAGREAPARGEGG